MQTLDQIVDRMMTSGPEGLESLREWVYEAYKDFYGMRGRHAYNMGHAECVSWILSHYVWNYECQIWAFKEDTMS